MVSVVCWWMIVLLMGVARKVIFGPILCLLVALDWILGARWNRDTNWRQLDDEDGPGHIWASDRAWSRRGLGNQLVIQRRLTWAQALVWGAFRSCSPLRLG